MEREEKEEKEEEEREKNLTGKLAHLDSVLPYHVLDLGSSLTPSALEETSVLWYLSVSF